VFDKKRKRIGKDGEKKRLIKKTNLSLSLPHLHVVLLSEKKRIFKQPY